MPTLLDHLLVLYVGVVGPIYYATVGYPEFKRAVARNEPTIRLRSYQHGVFRGLLWSVFLCALWFSFGRSFASIGIVVPRLPLLAIGLLPAVAVALLLSVWRRSLQLSKKERNYGRRQLGSLLPSLPATREELRWFMACAVAVGVSEEIIYRGFLIWYFAHYAGYLAAFFASSALFGFAHIYQGGSKAWWKGIFGMLFAGIYLVTESLWVPIALHIYVDVETARIGHVLLGPCKEVAE